MFHDPPAKPDERVKNRQTHRVTPRAKAFIVQCILCGYTNSQINQLLRTKQFMMEREPDLSHDTLGKIRKSNDCLMSLKQLTLKARQAAHTGSGRHSARTGKPQQGNLPDLAVAELRAQNVFESNKSATWSRMDRHGRVTEFHASMDGEDDNKLHFGAVPPVDRKGKQDFFETEVELSWSDCNFGGRRAWLLCPGRAEEPCGRRVAHLYIDGSHLVCRHCARIGDISDLAKMDLQGLRREMEKMKRWNRYRSRNKRR